MKIVIDVKRAEQVFDLDAGVARNFLVFEVFGNEIRIPCSEEQLTVAIRETLGAAVPPEFEEPVEEYSEEAAVSPREPQGLFSTLSMPDSSEPIAQVPARPRTPQISRPPRPVAQKEPSDDSGIAQG